MEKKLWVIAGVEKGIHILIMNGEGQADPKWRYGSVLGDLGLVGMKKLVC